MEKKEPVPPEEVISNSKNTNLERENEVMRGDFLRVLHLHFMSDRS